MRQDASESVVITPVRLFDASVRVSGVFLFVGDIFAIVNTYQHATPPHRRNTVLTPSVEIVTMLTTQVEELTTPI